MLTFDRAETPESVSESIAVLDLALNNREKHVHFKSTHVGKYLLLRVSNFATSPPACMKSWRSSPSSRFGIVPEALSSSLCFGKSAIVFLLFHVIVVNVEHRVLPLCIGHSQLDRAEQARVGEISARRLSPKNGDMGVLRQLRNFRIPWLTTIILAAPAWVTPRSRISDMPGFNTPNTFHSCVVSCRPLQ